MPFFSDKEIDTRVSSPDNLINRLEIHSMRNTEKGSTQIPMEIRKVAAILGNEGETCRDVATGLGIGKTSVNNYEHGQGSPELKRVVDAAKSELEQNRVSAESKAVDALLMSLELLPEALSRTKKAKTISSVAKDMAAIANQMGGRDGDRDADVMHLHIYAPKQKSIKDYEVIDV